MSPFRCSVLQPPCTDCNSCFVPCGLRLCHRRLFITRAATVTWSGLVRQELNAIPVDTKDLENGMTPLMVASANGHTQVVQLLLDNGAAINEKNKNNKTALMLAKEYGHTEVVQLLENQNDN